MDKKEFIVSFTIDVLTTAHQAQKIMRLQDCIKTITLCDSVELTALDVEYSDVDVIDLLEVEGVF